MTGDRVSGIRRTGPAEAEPKAISPWKRAFGASGDRRKPPDETGNRNIYSHNPKIRGSPGFVKVPAPLRARKFNALPCLFLQGAFEEFEVVIC